MYHVLRFTVGFSGLKSDVGLFVWFSLFLVFEAVVISCLQQSLKKKSLQLLGDVLSEAFSVTLLIEKLEDKLTD